jgi:hypothetical protein
VHAAIVEKLAREPAERPSAQDVGKDLFGRHDIGWNDLRSCFRRSVIARNEPPVLRDVPRSMVRRPVRISGFCPV